MLYSTKEVLNKTNIFTVLYTPSAHIENLTSFLALHPKLTLRHLSFLATEGKYHVKEHAQIVFELHLFSYRNIKSA